jgi:putative hydrolase of the HAD superfamily
LPIDALMVDVDGVLVDGRPEDGRHWQTSLQEDLGISPDALREHFFARCWENVVVGRAGLMEHLVPALQKVAPHVRPAEFVSYWFERDSRIVAPCWRNCRGLAPWGFVCTWRPTRNISERLI